MNNRYVRVVVSLAVTLAAFSQSAKALQAPSGFETEERATKACGKDEVVWIDLSKGRFYHKDETEYGANKNGLYSCKKIAEEQYPGARR